MRKRKTGRNSGVCKIKEPLFSHILIKIWKNKKNGFTHRQKTGIMLDAGNANPFGRRALQRTTLKKKISKTDYVLQLFPVVLSFLGLVALYSATFSTQSLRKLFVQTAALILGIGLMTVLSRLDYRAIKSYRKHLYLASVFALVLVLVLGIGKESVGAKSWIRFFGIGIQPSEPVKIAFALITASRLDGENGCGAWGFKTLTKRLLPLAVIIGLVVLQNDTGTALVYLVMLAAMVFAAGVPLRYFGFLLLAFAILSPLLWHILADYQRNRILTFLDPSKDPSGAGYQVLQARLAIGGGGVLGRGFLNGPRTQLSLLPEKDTDFIFAVIGEEFGFLGCATVVLLLFLFLLKCLVICRRARDNFGRLTAVGIFAMFLSHIAENIGMCLGLLPVTGIPLPFFSYGGSSLITCFLAAGVLLSIDKTTKKGYFYS